ncbi:MAG: hypothetical protein DRJ10_04000 [Bacteroidetes bacterium]|nr:MAG: hypothetical protein DRJ10_04000 [Bacteroidota bacterium]
MLIAFITLIAFHNIHSQTTSDSSIVEISKQLKGVVLDMDKKTALAYANIAVLHKNKGTVTNEKGQFTIDVTDLDENDTLSFLYIGYKNKNITIAQLDSFSIIYLKEDIFNLSEVFVFAKNPDPKQIVKKVLEHKDANYKKKTNKSQIFIRKRNISDINNIKFTLKKSSFDLFNKKTLDFIEKKLPKHSTSYTDFLGYLYSTQNQDDSIALKIDPLKIVSLKEKDLADFDQLEANFEKIFANTKEEEFWKVKSGIFSGKIDLDDEDKKSKKDSLEKNYKNQINLDYYSRRIDKELDYSLFKNKKEWEFLYQTGKYNYTLAGGANVNGEDVYIIDFIPRRNGEFKGRAYISMNTFALIRADYEYAPGKIGRNVQLLGIGYTQNHFKASIFFLKKNASYNLKYFSKETGNNSSVNRSFSLIKKKKRFLINKKLSEIKADIKLSIKSKVSFEMLVLNQKEISLSQFANFKQKKRSKIIYVDQFSDNLWKGYSIIEPTKQMRDYKKLKE